MWLYDMLNLRFTSQTAYLVVSCVFEVTSERFLCDVLFTFNWLAIHCQRWKHFYWEGKNKLVYLPVKMKVSAEGTIELKSQPSLESLSSVYICCAHAHGVRILYLSMFRFPGEGFLNKA